MSRDAFYGGIIVMALAAFLGIVAIKGTQQQALSFIFGPPQNFTIKNPITELANAIACAVFGKNCPIMDPNATEMCRCKDGTVKPCGTPGCQ